MNPQQEQPFENTPEAQEYLGKLQSERIELTRDATLLEHEALKMLKQTQQNIRQATTRHGDIEKQIASMQTQKDQITKDIDMMSGEATGYARMLVSAEGARRSVTKKAASKAEAKAATPPIENGGNGKAQIAPSKPGPKPKLKAVTLDDKQPEAQV